MPMPMPTRMPAPIRPAGPPGPPVLQDLGVRAGQMFRTLGMDAVG
ncbi:hypothetical protein [Streptomyces sp. NPDC007088]